MSVRKTNRSTTRLTILQASDYLYNTFQNIMPMNIQFYIECYLVKYPEEYNIRINFIHRSYELMMKHINLIRKLSLEYDELRNAPAGVNHVRARFYRLHNAMITTEWLLSEFNWFCRNNRDVIRNIGQHSLLIENMLDALVACKRYEYEKVKVIPLDKDPKRIEVKEDILTFKIPKYMLVDAPQGRYSTDLYKLQVQNKHLRDQIEEYEQTLTDHNIIPPNSHIHENKN